mmetsp:Transcript_41397/g.90406  ORF Transcript_41397/g.90406 Transcript_41397/m.90406 type:complete len:240 (+) Transcript_41397:49-768(+)
MLPVQARLTSLSSSRAAPAASPAVLDTATGGSYQRRRAHTAAPDGVDPPIVADAALRQPDSDAEARHHEEHKAVPAAGTPHTTDAGTAGTAADVAAPFAGTDAAVVALAEPEPAASPFAPLTSSDCRAGQPHPAASRRIALWGRGNKRRPADPRTRTKRRGSGAQPPGPPVAAVKAAPQLHAKPHAGPHAKPHAKLHEQPEAQPDAQPDAQPHADAWSVAAAPAALCQAAAGCPRECWW